MQPKAFLLPSVSLVAAVALAGCAGMQTTASAPLVQSAIKLNGSVHGGQQPVVNAHVYLFAVGTTGYGSASSSLLSAANTGASDAVGAYVTSDVTGSFDITGDYTCPSPSAQTYVLALGGNPGLAPGTNNTAISLITALGSCGNLNGSTTLVVNEVSTAAAVTALQQFMVDGTHIGTSPGNTIGITNAFTSITDLVTLGTGAARTTNSLGLGSVPQTKLNTLGNILAPCVNSNAPTSTACSGLFTAATPSGGTAPTNVVSAMLSIAQHPGSNTTPLYQQATPTSPFQPSLSAAPNDYTIGITYTGGGLTSPGSVVIDSNGDAFTANCPSCNGVAGTDSIVGFSPRGQVLTGTNGYTSGIHMPQGIAFDLAGDIWVTNNTPDSIVRLTSAGTLEAGFPYLVGLSKPLGIAIDPSNNAYVTNQTGNNVVKISPAGTLTYTVSSPGFAFPTGIGLSAGGNLYAAGTGSNSILRFALDGTILSGSGAGYTGGGLNAPLGVAIDHNFNIFTIDNGTNAISEINGNNGNPISSAAGYNSIGLYQAAVVAIDGAGTAWIANCRVSCPGSGSTSPDNVLHISATGTLIDPSDGLQDANFKATGTAAIDGSGNLWVSNNTGGSLTELIGVAAPVVTNLARAAATNQVAIRP